VRASVSDMTSRCWGLAALPTKKPGTRPGFAVEAPQVLT